MQRAVHKSHGAVEIGENRRPNLSVELLVDRGHFAQQIQDVEILHETEGQTASVALIGGNRAAHKRTVENSTSTG